LVPVPTTDPTAVRELSWHAQANGSWRLSGVFDAAGGAIIRTALDPLAKPRPAADGRRDERSARRRNADALLTMADQQIRGVALPESGGERPHLLITMTLADLKADNGIGTTADGTLLTMGEIRRQACDAGIIPVVLGSNSEPLDIGRTSRNPTVAIRRAVIARDKGCAFPGCDRPPGWCDVHHVDFWTAHKGPTEVDNLVLLCGAHHDTVHHRGWLIRIVDGQPEFIAPKSVDADQRPRRNTLHHPPQLPRAG